MNTCNQVGIQDVSELPIDNLESTPDYFIAIREFQDEATGNFKETFTRVPGAKLFPSGNLDNVFSVMLNNNQFAVPAQQVVPAYVANQQTQNQVLAANGQHKAMFLVFQTLNGFAIAQNTGVLNILGGTTYIVGQQYYLATDGGVTTDASQTGQKLFIPISQSQLLLNMTY